MDIKESLANLDILVASTPVLAALAVGALALRPRDGNFPRGAESGVSLQLLQALPVDVSMPRYDLPPPQQHNRVNQIDQYHGHIKRWGGYLPSH